MTADLSGLTIDLDRPAAQAAALAYAGLPRPLFSKLPFDYRIVPLPLRTVALKVLSRLGPSDPVFPQWPIESSLDRPGLHDRRATPTLLVTHDIDSRDELDLIEPIRALERSFGVVSSWGFVPRISWPAERTARALVDEGCEVYWHDMAHDGRLPYASAAGIRGQFEAIDAQSPWARELMTAFRSGQLLMSPVLLAAIAERFEIDLSIPDTERGGPYGAVAGCGTVIPFRIGSLMEIPLTLPQDVFLRHVYGMDAAACLESWKTKVTHIASVGGVAVLNTHPVWVNPRRSDMWEAYRSFLAWMAGQAGAAISTPGAVRIALLAGSVESGQTSGARHASG